MTTLDDIPIELFSVICEYLEPNDVNHLRYTCKKYYINQPDYKNLITNLLAECTDALRFVSHYAQRLSMISNKSPEQIRECITNHILMELFPDSWKTIDTRNPRKDLIDLVYDKYVLFDLLDVFGEEQLLLICYNDVYKAGLHTLQRILYKEIAEIDVCYAKMRFL